MNENGVHYDDGWSGEGAGVSGAEVMVGDSESEAAKRSPRSEGILGRAVDWFIAAWRPYHWVNLVIVASYLALGFGQITNSSLGSVWNRQTLSSSYPDTIGPTLDNRSDEFWVGVPLNLWSMLVPGEVRVGELAAPSGWALGIPSGPMQAILFWDRGVFALAGLLPEAVVFALAWWLPALLLALTLPTMFAQLGARRRYGYAAVVLILASPAQVLWSMQVAGILGPTVAGSVAILAAYARFNRGQWVIPLLQSVLGGVVLSNAACRYPVWVLILTGSLLAAVVASVFLGKRGGWLAKLLPVGIAGLVSMAITVLAVLESAEGLKVLAETVYPGSRRSEAAAMSLSTVFGSPVIRGLIDQRLTASNVSELSSSFNILLVAFALLLSTQPWLWRKWRDHLALIVLAVFSLVWLVWGTVTLGGVSKAMPLLNMVPPERAIQVVGFLGVILFFLLLSSMTVVRLRVAVTVALVGVWLTGWAGSLLQANYLSSLSVALIWGCALGVGVAIFVLLIAPGRVWPVVVASGLAVATTIGTFPIQIGLGDFQNSDVARMLRTQGIQARSDGAVWASDQMAFDALMVANGVPSLSGVQRSGPDRSRWQGLDPTGAYVETWNRGAGYVHFVWEDGSPVVLTNPTPDVVQVTADPCVIKKSFPTLTHVVSTIRLSSPCLIPVQRVTWSRAQLVIYEIEGPQS